MDKAVDVLRSLTPCPKHPTAERRKRKESCLYWSDHTPWHLTIDLINRFGMVLVLSGKGRCPLVNSLVGGSGVPCVSRGQLEMHFSIASTISSSPGLPPAVGRRTLRSGTSPCLFLPFSILARPLCGISPEKRLNTSQSTSIPAHLRRPRSRILTWSCRFRHPSPDSLRHHSITIEVDSSSTYLHT